MAWVPIAGILRPGVPLRCLQYMVFGHPGQREEFGLSMCPMWAATTGSAWQVMGSDWGDLRQSGLLSQSTSELTRPGLQQSSSEVQPVGFLRHRGP